MAGGAGMIQSSLFGPTGHPGGSCERRVRRRPRHVPLIVGYGAGVNSLAVLIGLRDRDLRPDLISFADTRGEKPGTYAYFGLYLVPWLRKNGFPEHTTVVKESPEVGDLSLEAECLRRQTLPSRAFGMSSCAHRWKIEPQEKFLNHWPPAITCWQHGDKPIKALGYDDGESHRSGIESDGKLVYWYPLREWGWDREECERRIVAEGLPLPPKSACFFCPSSTKYEVLWLAKNHPDLFERAIAMERRALGNTEHPLQNVKGLGRHWSWEQLVNASESEREAMPSAPVESCTVCTEGSE